MGKKREQEIEDRIKARTPGNWRVLNARTGMGHYQIHEPSGGHVAVVYAYQVEAKANAELFANAPGDLEYLLKRVQTLEKQLAKTGWIYPSVVDGHKIRVNDNSKLHDCEGVIDGIYSITGRSGFALYRCYFPDKDVWADVYEDGACFTPSPPPYSVEYQKEMSANDKQSA